MRKCLSMWFIGLTTMKMATSLFMVHCTVWLNFGKKKRNLVKLFRSSHWKKKMKDNILDATHSSLNLDSIQAQVYLDNWAKPQHWQQEFDQQQTYEYLKNDQTTRTKSSND